MNDTKRRLHWARVWLALFIVGLALSGLTAIPIQSEVPFLQEVAGEGSWVERWWPGLAAWITHIHRGVAEVGREQPFLFYGTDWLAFGHIVIAVFFLGPLRDPVRNLWVIHAGMIACLLVVPWAFVFGPIRGIPVFWRLIDCSFGAVGIVPLYLAHRSAHQIVESGKERGGPENDPTARYHRHTGRLPGGHCPGHAPGGRRHIHR